jgi:hypothetical protein
MLFLRLKTILQKPQTRHRSNPASTDNVFFEQMTYIPAFKNPEFADSFKQMDFYFRRTDVIRSIRGCVDYASLKNIIHYMSPRTFDGERFALKLFSLIGNLKKKCFLS